MRYRWIQVFLVVLMNSVSDVMAVVEEVALVRQDCIEYF